MEWVFGAIGYSILWLVDWRIALAIGFINWWMISAQKKSFKSILNYIKRLLKK